MRGQSLSFANFVDGRGSVDMKLRLIEASVAAGTVLAMTSSVSLSALASDSAACFSLIQTSGTGAAGYAQIVGVKAGPFNASAWNAGTLSLLPDIRRPLLQPREGTCRNIYAPSVVETEHGWRVFYGAWDGVPTCNDRIYSAMTKDFLNFSDRHTVIEHGPFQHVCNVNTLRLPDGQWRMVCTAYPDKLGRNKPALFSSPDGRTWNASSEPCTASLKDIVTMTGYKNYDDADINGMNALLYERGQYTLYFGDFRNFGKVHQAVSKDGRSYTYERSVLDGAYAVNDVKKFRSKSKSWYLMGLHMNTDKLFYTLSENPNSFSGVKVLQGNIDSVDRYIVAIGWVTQGEQERSGRRVLGYLYGAGPDAALASNKIFATWLQKKIVLVDKDGRRIEPQYSSGPDRQLLPLTAPFHGRADVYAEDGRTLLGSTGPIALKAGGVYALER